ncbi:MAG TPA: ribose-phosphate pyrophosphokinase-like domain-containing protein [Chlamydiales bacterium]|nr:ribose-phosphate pyrophosphokinase-like domain-containing protein [Chlamydiales bacterium]
MKNSNNIIFSGSSHVKFAKDLVQSLDVSLGNLKIDQFPDGEIGVEILEDVEGKNVFVVQSLANRPNHFLMELLLIVDALLRASTINSNSIRK